MKSKALRAFDRRLWIAAVAAVAAVAPGCGNMAPPPADEPPEIPPASTLVIDFGDFTNEAAKQTAVAQQLPRADWLWSAGHVTVWNIALTVTLAVPVGAFVESFNHEAQRVGDSWVWAYDAVVGGQNYSAELRSTLVDSQIEWSMFISQTGGFSDVNWFTGLSNLTGTAGSWTLNRDPNNVTPFLSIDWNRDPSAGTADIRYTNIAEGDPQNGGSIFYGITNESPFDAFYEITNAATENVVRIEWNRTTKDGRVSDPDHFGDTDWHCWDAMLLNAECDEP